MRGGEGEEADWRGWEGGERGWCGGEADWRGGEKGMGGVTGLKRYLAFFGITTRDS